MEQKENMAVYDALRQHIVHMESAEMENTRYMYTIYFAVLSVSLFRNWMFPVTFMVLIVFQSLINSNRWGLEKGSAYLLVFFEEKRTDIHWESLHRFADYSMLHQTRNHNIGWHIHRNGATILGGVSLVMMACTVLLQVTVGEVVTVYLDLTPESTLQLAVSAVLYLITVYVNRLYFRAWKDGKLMEAVEEFYKQCYPQ